jgi:hypothetical protein
MSITLPTTDASEEYGTYATVPNFTPARFTGFQFTDPPTGSVTPLWTFNVGTTNYSFDASSVSSYYDASLAIWDIGGDGMAMVTGYQATPGTWRLTLSQAGSSFVFSSVSTAQAVVPDGGSTALVLGGSFIALAAFGRKAKR